MRSFVFNDITIPVAFKATCSRRAQLWNRQASIIMDLTTWPFVTGGIAFRAYDHRRSIESVGAVHGRVMRE